MKDNQKIYIAGKITGNPSFIQDFEQTESRLTAQGHVILNPAKIPNGLGYENCMHICFAMIDTVDVVYLMKNWKDSSGAKREREYGLKGNKQIVEEELEKSI